MWVQDLSNKNEPPPIQFSPFIGSGERRWPRWRLGGAAQRRQPRLGTAAALARNVKAAATEALRRRWKPAPRQWATAVLRPRSPPASLQTPPPSPPTLADLLHPSHRDAAPQASLAFGSPPQAPSLCDPLAIFDTVAASHSSGSPSHHRS
uniref:Uncharacterized protein n=1 Tax=Oryza meridionalis TaxID=40149 RepID=A0A0E0E6Q7_9ORYZ